MYSRDGKRFTVCDESRLKRSKIDDDGELNFQLPHLPEEVILENIVIRLSARDLAKWSCASKYWYKSILHDSRFASSHFDHNKNNLNLVFNLLNVYKYGQSIGYFLRIEEEEGKDNDVDGFLLSYRILSEMSSNASHELVGYCNGLVCTKRVGNPTPPAKGQIVIVNPTRRETLSLDYATLPTWKHLCHGFCFDSLSQSYKVVIIYTTESTGGQEFVCMVLTLGQGSNTDSWRKIVTSTAQMSPPPGSTYSSFPVTMRTRFENCRSATLCVGTDLVWRITNYIGKKNKTDMLLSFNIHDEKIGFISLPTECRFYHYSKVGYHLLEFKGYLCVARTEKITSRKHHHRHDHHPILHRRVHGKRSWYCCCGFKVHLFVLEDKINQVWIKEESFDLQIKEEDLLPAPFCCLFDTNPNALPTRILSFSDQLLLYWSDGEYILLYDLQMKCLKVVKCSGSQKLGPSIFQTKMENGIKPGRIIYGNDNANFPYMDYQLHAQAENILSLRSFIAEGEARKFNRYSDFQRSLMLEKKVPAVLLNTSRESVKYYAFY